MTTTMTETERATLAVVTRLLDEGFNQGDLDVCDELVAADCVEHQRGNPPGAEGHKQVIRTLRAWFDDFHIEIEDYCVQGDLVWLRNRATGTNSGRVLGRPPTGRPFEITVFDQCRVHDGRIVEHWGVPDQLGMMAQLGHFPPAPPAQA